MNFSNVSFLTFSGRKVSRSLKPKGGGLFAYRPGHLRSAWTGGDIPRGTTQSSDRRCHMQAST